MNEKGFTPILILIGILLLGLVAGGAYYLGVSKNNNTNTDLNKIITNSNQTETVTPTAQSKVTQPIISQLKDLGLIKSKPDSLNPEQQTDTIYYQVGSILEGKYKGYKRIIAVVQAMDPGGPRILIFATNNDQKYILSGNPSDATKYPEGEYNSPYYLVDKAKIETIADINFQPPTINLDQHFALQRNLEKQNNDIYYEYRDKDVLITDFSSYPKLKGNNPNFTYYYKKYDSNIASTGLSESQKNDELIKQKYLEGKTEVIVVDSQGLAFSYTLTTPEKASIFTQEKTQYNQGQTTNYPSTELNLGFIKSQVSTKENIYDNYNKALPAACASRQETYVAKNISERDLTKIGTINNQQLYALIDKKHQLYTVAYNSKINDLDETTFKEINKTNKPSIENYVAKIPILFLKDYWDRFVMLGEYDYQLMGGCGKPVIYLYPTKPTAVSLQFTSPMSFDTDIPKYHNQWHVLAKPNGELTDLQPEYTNCNEIDSSKKGSDYAKLACQRNKYPYLYWSGQSFADDYPTINYGWVVDNRELGLFLNSKLIEMGLNESERNDMLVFWLPEMLSKNTPYYKIAFLQTHDVNRIFPMNISPRPDTIFRIFLDWAPLQSKPSAEIKPQQLEKLKRIGFTLVEWGGLKQ